MWDDPDAARMRQHQREAERKRRQESQREDLIHAARILIPDHGIAVSLARIAVYAGLSRTAAAALFNTTMELAACLVGRAWRALIDGLEPAAGATPQDVVAGLIAAIRADAAAHRIHQALSCGIPCWLRAQVAGADDFLARAVGETLREVWPAIGPDAAEPIGRRVLALSRTAAFADPARGAAAGAAIIVAMVAATLPNTTAPNTTAAEDAAAANVAEGREAGAATVAEAAEADEADEACTVAATAAGTATGPATQVALRVVRCGPIARGAPIQAAANAGRLRHAPVLTLLPPMHDPPAPAD